MTRNVNNDRLTYERAIALFVYDPATGYIYWRPDAKTKTGRSIGKHRAGKVAGHLNETGYVRIACDGLFIGAHRLAYLLMTGAWPTDQIDHIDRNPSNNVWTNLRAVSCQENQINRRKSSRNTSGVRGVSYQEKYGKWRAGICDKGIIYELGFYERKEDAIAARKAKEIALGRADA